MHPFAFDDSEKKRPFFSERDKKLTTLYRVAGNLEGLVLRRVTINWKLC